MGDHEDMRCDGQGQGYAQAWSSTSELREAVSAVASTPMDRHTHHPRRVSAFRARSSSLSEGQQKVWDRSWPTFGRLARDPDGSCPPLDTAAWFGRTAPLILEIGCGTGTSTASMALQEPGFDVLAVEVYCKGLAQLLSAIDRAGIENIRLIRGDALDVLEYLLAPGSLTAARVFFPDPWPKARHHKRRLLQPSTVALLSDRLRPGGTLHVATDHANYAAHIARVGDNEPTLRRLELDDPRIPVSVNRPITKFEGKAHTVGSAINDFVWERL